MIVLYKLLLAHFIADFFLQPRWLIDGKQKLFASYHLYLHALIHLILTFLIIWDLSFWPWILTITISHLFIDAAKLHFQTDKTRTLLFFVDQGLHLLIIWLIWIFSQNIFISTTQIFNEQNYLFATLVVWLTFPASFIIKKLIYHWKPELDNQSAESLNGAGQFIGVVERLIVFVFVLTNHWELVGLLFVGKSVFYFTSFKEAKDRKLTEYILIGTLLSFGIAFVTGFWASLLI